VPGSQSVRTENVVVQAYRDKVASGTFQLDPVQLELCEGLDVLREELESRPVASKSSALGWLLGRRNSQQPTRGLYIWGSVGRGKSMLMDLFFNAVQFSPKRRVHFHDFMEDAQQRIHQHRQDFKDGKTKEEDPIPPVARALGSEAMLLCFDEFSVTDIADAMILGRLFQGLFKAGVVIVATSNVAPDNLYKDGLNRQRFLPFIELLKSNCREYMLDARTDYRLEKLSKAPVYMAPLGVKSEKGMAAAWERMTDGAVGVASSITVKGRKVVIPLEYEGVARFSFEDLCGKPLGSQDYLALARKFHTIFIDNVPIMAMEQRNQAKRFINLIDTLYDQGVKLVMSAEANPHALYSGRHGTESFEFERTASRLIEMQSEKYIAQR
jgi:cell division protein ZapE